MIKFTHESMLKQEEAHAELDASIDDWVTKLEMAENRRIRVRQKLLEHVAAAAIMAMPDTTTTTTTTAASKLLQQAVGVPGISNVGDMSTPPRRPPTRQGTSSSTRTATSSPSPQRVVAQVPSTILENPIVEEAGTCEEGQMASRSTSWRNTGVESIRIYAGDDIGNLLTDVESEISRISQDKADPFAAQALLSGLVNLQRRSKTFPQRHLRCVTPESPPAPPPPAKDYLPSRLGAQGGRLSRTSVRS